MQVARVWDALFSEGSKVLFRTALAILKAQEETLLGIDNAGGVKNRECVSQQVACTSPCGRTEASTQMSAHRQSVH